jgi:hypothetical protein
MPSSSHSNTNVASKSVARFVNPELTLPAPTVNVLQENDADGDELELWTLRLPVEFSLGNLDGVEFNLKDWLSADNEAVIKDGKGNTYRVVQGDATEAENFRVLLPIDEAFAAAAAGSGNEGKDDDDDDNSRSNHSSSENEDDDDNSSDSDSGESFDSDGLLKSKSKIKGNKEHKEKDNGNKDDDESKNIADNTNANKFLYPCRKPFARHFNVVKSFPKMSETQLAPLKGPEPADDAMRHAYAPIPQRKGLKRRWMPTGAETVPLAAAAIAKHATMDSKKLAKEHFKSAKDVDKPRNHSKHDDGVIVSPAEEDEHEEQSHDDDAEEHESPTPVSSSGKAKERKRKAEKKHKKEKKSKKHKRQKTVVDEE